MSVAAPKSQAKEPIQLDVIFVCQKREQDLREPMEPFQALEQTANLAQDKLTRLRKLGLTLSQNDCRVTVVSQFLAQLGPVRSPNAAVDAVTSCQSRLEQAADAARSNTDELASASVSARAERQLTLFALPE
ncbi:MAG TPA: hypothetical protein PLF81_17385 [Candidatus Anammoximicrobium sp.]|nr:hypothetical protein [Candidatus Anammoximicrobium sp.]